MKKRGKLSKKRGVRIIRESSGTVGAEGKGDLF